MYRVWVGRGVEDLTRRMSHGRRKSSLMHVAVLGRTVSFHGFDSTVISEGLASVHMASMRRLK